MYCIVFTFEKSFAHALGGVRGAAFFISAEEQLQLNKGCYFSMHAMLPESFPVS